jgi:hypothetical protein
MAPKKARCTFKECPQAAQRIVGDCGFCSGHFCGKHRLLEDHKCTGLEDVSDSPTIEWWLVGLSDGLGEHPAADMMIASAKSNRVNGTQPSSSPSVHRSLRVFDENYDDDDDDDSADSE